MSGYVCTVAGGKGGVGKTTTAVNAAGDGADVSRHYSVSSDGNHINPPPGLRRSRRARRGDAHTDLDRSLSSPVDGSDPGGGAVNSYLPVSARTDAR